MKKYWTMLLVLCMCMYSWAFAVNVETFDLTQTSAPVGPQSNRMGPINVESDEYLKIINVANDYLRFSLAAVSTGVLIYIGFLLMTAQGDKSKMQQANRALVGMVIGLVLAYFSYTIVRMVVNWF